MRNQSHLPLTILLVLSLVLSPVVLPSISVVGLRAGDGSAWAQGDPGKVRSDLKRKKANLGQQRKRLDIINERERDLSQQLNEVQADLQDSKSAYYDTIDRLGSAKARLSEIRSKLKQANLKYRHTQKVLGKRLREIYLEGDMGYLVVLLGAQSFSAFLDHSRYLTIIINNDSRLLEQVRSLKAELESQTQAAQDMVEEINQLKRGQEQRMERLASIEKSRSNLLADIQSQRDSVASYVTELEGSTKELEAKLRATISSQQVIRFYPGSAGGARQRGTGRFITPAAGPITSPYGYRVHPIFGTMRFHSGIDIGAYYASAILAADSGTVIDAGWMGGYGNAVIIDHGGGYSTLYGHCSQLYVSVGQGVRKGQQIAAVGSTGNSTGPHLHFEVRINGNPVDPLGFI